MMRDHLYYIFPIENITSIVINGIQPKNWVDNFEPDAASFALEGCQQIRSERQIRAPDGRCFSIHDFVPLYFNPFNPVLYKLRPDHEKLAIAVISLADLFEFGGVSLWCISDGNLAAGTKTKIYFHEQDLQKLDWDLIYGASWDHSDEDEKRERKRKRCAEFLVYPNIDAMCIERFAVFNFYAKMNLLKDLDPARDHGPCHAPVCVDPLLFSRGLSL